VPHKDPFKPPEKVTDPEVAELLRALLGAVESRFDVLEAAVRDSRPEPDPALRQVVELLTALVARPDPHFPAPVVPAPTPPVDLSPIVAAIERSGLDNKTLLDELKRTQPTVVGGSQVRQVKLLGASGGLITAATEGTLGLVRSEQATEATLAGLAAEDFATQATLAQVLTTLQSIDDALNNTDNAAQAATAGVAPGTFGDVVSLTRPNAITIVGFNTDPDALVSFDFRYRLTVGGAVKVSEVVAANRLSWIPVTIDVAASTTVKVQVFHTQATAQDFQASIAYRE
jgi:hypothetical protein